MSKVSRSVSSSTQLFMHAAIEVEKIYLVLNKIKKGREESERKES